MSDKIQRNTLGNVGLTLGNTLRVAISVLTFGVSTIVHAGLFGFGGDSWKEEVLLHDGSKVIVKRSQSYGGRGEIGQGGPIKEHTITYALPHTGKSVSFRSEFSQDVGRANFNLLALNILNCTPDVVTEPNLCLSYNNWGRPNPPYVSFKHDSKSWQRIPMTELPVEFKTINLSLGVRRWQVETPYDSAGNDLIVTGHAGASCMYQTGEWLQRRARAASLNSRADDDEATCTWRVFA
jgi:hypothetical protein